MAKFSIGDAAVEGFQQIGAHWRLLLGWGFFSLMAVIGGLAVVFALALGLSVTGSSVAAGAGAVIGVIVMALAILLITVAIGAASWRLILRPDDTLGFMRLRLRADEWRFLGFSLSLASIWVLCMGAGVIAMRGAAPNAITGLGVFVVSLLVAAWLTLRLAFTPAGIIENHRLDFAFSWRLTRGRQWALLGLALLVLCLSAVVALVYNALWAALAVSTMGWSGLQALVRPDVNQSGHFGFTMLQTVAQLMFSPFWNLLWVAAFAAAYKAVAAPDSDATSED
jgi:hypothetical protein